MLLLRHAESVWNEQGRFQGWADPPLSVTGHTAARSWAARSSAARSRAGLDAVVSSDLARSRHTAELIAEAAGLAGVEVRQGLREQSHGAWTGLTKAEVKRRWPQQSRLRPRQPPGGETQTELTERAMAELDHLASSYDGQRILVVTHAGVIKAVERVLGCDDVPVPHLGGRWITSDESLAGLTKGWLAGERVPHFRGVRTSPEPEPEPEPQDCTT